MKSVRVEHSPGFLAKRFPRLKTSVVFNHRLLTCESFVKALPSGILYMMGLFSKRFWTRLSAEMIKQPETISLTSNQTLRRGALEIGKPELIRDVWTDQPLEYFGFILTKDRMPKSILCLQLEDLDKGLDFLSLDYEMPDQIIRMLEGEDGDYLMLTVIDPSAELML